MSAKINFENVKIYLKFKIKKYRKIPINSLMLAIEAAKLSCSSHVNSVTPWTVAH